MRLFPQLSAASVPPPCRFSRSSLQRMACLSGLLFVFCSADTPDLFSTSHATGAEPEEPAPTKLFNGTDLTGWEGNTDLWTVSSGSIVGRSSGLKQNEFLSTTETYGDFELSLEFRLEGGQGNSGIQFRSLRVPGSSAMEGYQADIGQQYWGCLYDEHRRKKILAQAPPELFQKLKKAGWNQYTIRAEGNRIRLTLNGVTTVNYTEKDASLPATGLIALQLHSGPPMKIEFRNLKLTRLETPAN